MRRQLHALLDAGFGPLDFFSHDIRKWVGWGINGRAGGQHRLVGGLGDQRQGRRTTSSFCHCYLGRPLAAQDAAMQLYPAAKRWLLYPLSLCLLVLPG